MKSLYLSVGFFFCSPKTPPQLNKPNHMTLEGGSFVVSSAPLELGLKQSGEPCLVVCDADFISLYPELEGDDDHFIFIHTCKPGVWTSILMGDTLVLIMLSELKSDEDTLRREAWIGLQDLDWTPWTSHTHTPIVQVDHGNLAVFSAFSYPKETPQIWVGEWINCCFDLTTEHSLDVTGSVTGPVGSIWRLPESCSSVRALDVLKSDSGKIVGLRVSC
eukprot:Blabericola_migrator_1__6195@NODE_3129_length_2016_cov_309_804002_g1959_i0_p2_GENE_NODE_3129_length_2016_cov_309_804002_g1959_i0NODE_3129_length_2016_cov_309_804002_g1959_i0_p2_ORF_typecomplete_len218_score21_22_NODE_3129_length_2016_cov_309_804002_g1959_i0129782